ncbi:hypothetical protein B0T16DRAFT_419361 [Cercophora newfieldiana]|uniref:Uncharacterized protein n=1 Tax=Cercophora newfieldiana TaxID=92897 RepID=A0AA39XVS2_9PEZI|nr:hypothetical protein B0T16DRAFT_419361 [Cercophora newfieldiana]
MISPGAASVASGSSTDRRCLRPGEMLWTGTSRTSPQNYRLLLDRSLTMHPLTSPFSSPLHTTSFLPASFRFRVSQQTPAAGARTRLRTLPAPTLSRLDPNTTPTPQCEQ